jgi:hypothetical protein
LARAKAYPLGGRQAPAPGRGVAGRDFRGEVTDRVSDSGAQASEWHRPDLSNGGDYCGGTI